jgi:NTE family protein
LKSYKVLHSKWLLLLFTVGIILVSVNVSAEPAARPRIALTLGGGSAKGFAHIGVLKWLEEHRVPVDIVTGTSIGGLIGSMYAMGMEPQAIHDLVRGIDWQRTFNPTPDYDILDFRRKEDRREFPVDLQFGLRDAKFRFPAGMATHQINLIFSRITLPYSMVKNFDELPIPFRCVATDISRTEAVVLGSGSLASALRATMSLPGIFAPEEREGRTLVDGGLVNNLPVEVAREMKADVVIAVNLHAHVREKEIKGIDSVAMRSISTVIIENSRRSARLADVVIGPDLEDITSSSWSAADRMVVMGYQAAAQQAALLQKYALDEAAWRQHLKERYSRRRTTIPVPQRVEVIGTSPINAAHIHAQLDKYAGHPIATVALERDLTLLTGSTLYDSLRYELAYRDGLPVLVIVVIEKSYGPPFMDFALNLSSDGARAEDLDINASLRFTAFNITTPGSEFRLDLGIGTEVHLNTELYQPLGHSNWFVAPLLYLSQDDASIFSGTLRISEYKLTNFGASFYFGRTFNRFTEGRLGYTLEYQNARTKVGLPIVSAMDGYIHSVDLQWTLSSADEGMLSRRGFFWDIHSRWYGEGVPGATEPFSQTDINLIWKRPVRADDIFFFRFATGATYDGVAPTTHEFRLGGPFRLGSFTADRLRDQNFILTNVGYLYSLGKMPLTGKPFYLGLWVEHGGVYDDWAALDSENNVSVGLLSQTIFGPVYIGASYGRGENQVFYFGVGKMF